MSLPELRSVATIPNGIGIASLLSLNAGNWIADAAGNNSSLSFASKLPTTLPRIRIP